MKPSCLALPAAILLLAGPAWAQTETDAVKKDGDPTVVGSPANPEQGPDSAAEAQTVAPAPTTAAAPTRLYTDPAPATTATRTVANAPIPDTAENRERFGGPLSRAGKRTEPAGN